MTEQTPAQSRAPTPTITAMVLAGGQSSRMGGHDKGLQQLAGRPLAAHVLERLRQQPLITTIAINANRHPEEYNAFGVPVWQDGITERPGPMAGFITGLRNIDTEWMMVVPCDAPFLPLDLAERLLNAARSANAEIAMAASEDPDRDTPQPEPMFTLMHRSLLPSAESALAEGERRVRHWAQRHRLVMELFVAPAAGPHPFANANSPVELESLSHWVLGATPGITNSPQT